LERYEKFSPQNRRSQVNFCFPTYFFTFLTRFFALAVRFSPARRSFKGRARDRVNDDGGKPGIAGNAGAGENGVRPLRTIGA
jgi:hypothetical protein